MTVYLTDDEIEILKQIFSKIDFEKTIKYPDDKIEKVVDYFIQNRNKYISIGELRKQKFVNNNIFADWMARNWSRIIAKLNSMGFSLKEYKPERNKRFYMVKHFNA